MHLLDRFVERVDFESYEDFTAHFRVRVPDNFNFAYDVVDVYARETPEKRALVWCDDHGHDKTVSFGELKRNSDKAAHVFRRHGIRKGDHVMLILKGRYEFWYCLLGLHRIGAIAAPATHMLTNHDIEYRVRSADIKMVVCVASDGLLDHVDAVDAACDERRFAKVVVDARRDGWIDFAAELDAAPDTFDRPIGADATRSDDPLLVYFSSGTSGPPKMAQHDHSYPLAHILTAKYWQNVIDDGLHYTVADTGWAKCVWGKIYGQWIAGSAVFVYDYERFAADSMLEKAARHGVTTFCAPPTVYRFLIREDLSRYDLSSIRYCVTAGEPLNPEVYDRFLEHTGLRIMEGYGQTETVVLIATYPWIEPRPGSMGKPSPLYRIDIVDRDGRPCDVGDEGEIVIDTADGNPPGIMTGYYRDAARTHQVWHDGRYHTGDMAWRDEDGYYWFIGRADDVIKSSGYRIGPFEVESALIQHPAVLECAITAVPDPLRGQVVKATVVLTKDYAPSDALVEELQEHVRRVTAPYKYPRIVEFIEALPKTISGKIRRVEIRDHDAEGQ
ncbi:MAG TPA: AMP-binding protein [Candidatus Hydrogenedentes bacterium]|mgnify:CR=1 FL=1|nr:AMP-binding protein [Candidatus Hydrogenedentota bacterium]HPG70307.1 AMP-binding protein [Candidatus Hydrogenedentota bacterium]